MNPAIIYLILCNSINIRSGIIDKHSFSLKNQRTKMEQETKVAITDKKITAYVSVKLMKDMLDSIGIKECMSAFGLP